jgi:hypothetical protein
MKPLEPVHQKTYDVFDIVEVLLRPSELSGRGSSSWQNAGTDDLDIPTEHSRDLVFPR